MSEPETAPSIISTLKSIKSTKSSRASRLSVYADNLSRAPSQPYSFLEDQRINREERKSDGLPEVKEAPDGGWGWLIVVAAFWMNFTLDGIMYTHGIYYTILRAEFGVPPSHISLIGSLCSGLYMAISPVASITTERLGCRIVSLVGCVWAALSILGAYFSENVDVLILSNGASLGLAFGFLYLPSLVIVGLWFDKKRGIAMGVVTAASGVGMLAMPPICQVFIDAYGWRKSLFFQIALVLLGIPLTFLYRDVPSQYTNSQFQRTKKPKRSISQKFLDSIPYKRRDKTKKRKNTDYIKSKSFDDVIFEREDSDVALNPGVRSASLGNLSEFTLKDDFETHGCCYKFAVGVLHLDAAKDKCFVVCLTAYFIVFLGYFIPFAFTKDFATLLGASTQEGTLLITISGITNTIFRVIFCVLVSFNKVDPVSVTCGSLIIGGFLTMMVIFLKSYWQLAVYAGLFGICAAGLICNISLVVVHLFGVKNLSVLLGYLLFGIGIGAMSGPPVLGLLFDEKEQDYTMVYLASGAVLLWAGTIGLLFQQIADKQWKLYPERYIAQHRGESGSVQSDSELIPLNDNHYEPDFFLEEELTIDTEGRKFVDSASSSRRTSDV